MKADAEQQCILEEHQLDLGDQCEGSCEVSCKVSCEEVRGGEKGGRASGEGARMVCEVGSQDGICATICLALVPDLRAASMQLACS